MWSLVRRLDGQVRAYEGRVIGWDMTAALAMAQVMGCARAAVWLLPIIEPVMAREINNQRG